VAERFALFADQLPRFGPSKNIGLARARIVGLLAQP
jgi:hypothetical protein